MAVNFPGPFEARFSILTNEAGGVGQHQLRLSTQVPGGVNPGQSFGTIFPEQRGGAVDISLQSACEALLGLINGFYATTSAFGAIELWEYIPDSFDAVFRSAYSPSTEPNGGATTVPASQTYFTFRTINGGIMKLCLMGTTIVEDSSQAYPTGDSEVNAVFAAFLADTSIWWGRDNSFPIAGLKFLPGRNEDLWKKLYRSS